MEVRLFADIFQESFLSFLFLSRIVNLRTREFKSVYGQKFHREYIDCFLSLFYLIFRYSPLYETKEPLIHKNGKEYSHNVDKFATALETQRSNCSL